MKATDIRVTTGADASASLGIVTATRFHPFPKNPGETQQTLEALTFAEEIKQLQALALERDANAITGVSFAVNNLPGGVFVVATGTAVKG